MTQRRTFIALSVAALLATPLAASAQDRYAGDHYDGGDRTIEGRIVAAEPYNLQLDHGPHIFLHNGTVIRPRGISLRDGMPVRVIGHRTEHGFAADEVDLIRHHGGDRDGDFR